MGPRIAQQAADDLAVLHVAVKADGFFLPADHQIGAGEQQGEQPDDPADQQDRIPFVHGHSPTFPAVCASSSFCSSTMVR